MERSEAETIYAAGREPVVEALLALTARLEAQDAQLAAVAELPPLAVEISEHRLQRLCCQSCGGTVRAELPTGVPRGCFGPKLEAAIASLTVRNRLSRRQLVELMEELFGCPSRSGRSTRSSAGQRRR